MGNYVDNWVLQVCVVIKDLRFACRLLVGSEGIDKKMETYGLV